MGRQVIGLELKKNAMYCLPPALAFLSAQKMKQAEYGSSAILYLFLLLIPPFLYAVHLSFFLNIIIFTKVNFLN